MNAIFSESEDQSKNTRFFLAFLLGDYQVNSGNGILPFKPILKVQNYRLLHLSAVLEHKVDRIRFPKKHVVRFSYVMLNCLLFTGARRY
jgi:hypothetical protein